MSRDARRDVDAREDMALVDRFKRGDGAAFEELVSRYEGKLYNMGRRMCGHDEDAKEMLQETFLAAYRSLKDFRGDSKFSVWLFKVAKNFCIKMKRKSVYAPEQELSLDALMPDRIDAEPMMRVDWHRTPAEQLLRKELRGILNEAIGALPPDYRMVFLLRDTEGLETAEVAEILDISQAAVKSRLHRARLFLRKQLDQYFREKKMG